MRKSKGRGGLEGMDLEERKGEGAGKGKGLPRNGGELAWDKAGGRVREGSERVEERGAEIQ